jgi:hypothetical protein
VHALTTVGAPDCVLYLGYMHCSSQSAAGVAQQEARLAGFTGVAVRTCSTCIRHM